TVMSVDNEVSAALTSDMPANLLSFCVYTGLYPRGFLSHTSAEINFSFSLSIVTSTVDEKWRTFEENIFETFKREHTYYFI
ncbi:hypothetical protein, partial [Paenibacillus vulneris]